MAISNSQSNVLVSGTSANDSISSTGSNVTINAGTGNDTISLGADASNNVIHYKSGDGNDLVYGVNETTTLKITQTSPGQSYSWRGDDVIIGVGNGSITLAGAGSLESVFDNVEYEQESSTLATEGDDYLSNYSDSVSIAALGGNDTIYNRGDNVSINAGKGNDSIDNNGSNVSINAGAGNDSIESYGDNVTISGGTGNDFVDNRGIGTAYVYTGGNDTIAGFDQFSTLVIADSYTTLKQEITDEDGDFDGYEVIITVEGKGTITLADYWDDSVNIVSSVKDIKPLNIIVVEDDNESVTGTSGNDFIDMSGIVYNATVNAVAGDDLVSISGITDNATVNAGAGDDSIYISGIAESLTVDGGDGNDYIYNNGGDEASIVGGAGNDTIVNDEYNVTIDAGEGDDFVFNSDYYASIVGGAGNDTIENYWGDDATIDGGTSDDYIHNDSKNVLFKYTAGDGNDTIIGLDEDSTLQIGGGTGTYATTKSGDDIIVTVGDGKIILSGAADLDTINIEGVEKELVPVKIKKYSNTSSTAKVTLASAYNVADATARTKAAIRIVGNALDNSILGGSKNDTLYGKDGDDSIDGNAGNDKLYGQNGNDTLWGGAGNDTLTGGDGDDLFVYSAGKDVIADYAEGDMISIGAAISKSSVSGSDAIFTIGSSTLKVKNGKGKEITFLDANGDERTILGGTIGLALTDKSSAKITAAATYELLDASTRTKAIQITGNELDNTLLGGSGKDTLYGKDGNDYLVGSAGNDKLYGQSGNDTLWGGSGNDTLIGGDGADVFLYKSGEGKDVISGFANNDMLLITGDFSASYDKSTKTVAFDFYGGSITLQDFTASSFNVNGFKYRIKGTKLVKK